MCRILVCELRLEQLVADGRNARHYADPALLGVLNASLAPFNNDLYASNLASVPVLALHGSADNNVPARHSRAHIAILNSWLHAETPKEVSYTEVPGEGHWWDGILRDPAVLAFLRDLPPRKSMDDVRNAGFTLTTANPDESGSKGGIRIVELAVPGRLARLDVNAPQWKRGDGEGLSLHSTNIRRIEVTGWAQGATGTDADADAEAQVLVREDGQWRPDTRPRPIPPVRAYGPMIRLLATEGTITLVVPDQTEGGGSPSASSAALLGLALQYADDLRTYHRIDVVIATATEALHAVAEDALPGNIVAYGRPEENRFVDWLVRQERTPGEL
jgi:hypothetical protein